jgi:hypothetical protein
VTDLDLYTGLPKAPVVYEPPRKLTEWAAEARAAHEMATGLCETSFVPTAFRGKPMEAAAAILAGSEVGLSPMAALNAYDVIQGRPAPKAITLRALVQSHGHELWLDSASPSKAVVKGQRLGSNRVQSSEWTIERARDMQLTSKPNWKSQPMAMLIARATSECARLVAADVLLGIPYSSEELADLEPEPTAPVQRASRRVQRQAAPTPPEPAFEDTGGVSSQDEKAAGDPTDTTTPGSLHYGADQPQPPTPEPPTEPDPITAKQLTALNAALSNDLGFTERDDKLAYLSGELGRDVGSSKEITRDEASRLLYRIKTWSEPDEPALPEPPLDGDPS